MHDYNHFRGPPCCQEHRRRPLADDRAKDTLAGLQLKLRGLDVAAKLVEPTPVSPLMLRLANACVNSAGWAPQCYSCWTAKTA